MLVSSDGPSNTKQTMLPVLGKRAAVVLDVLFLQSHDSGNGGHCYEQFDTSSEVNVLSILQSSLDYIRTGKFPYSTDLVTELAVSSSRTGVLFVC